MKQVIKALFQRAGYELVNVREPSENNLERERYSPADVAIYSQVREYTMVGPVGTIALVQAVEYLLRNRIPGAFVECGVWRGGQMMAVALTLLRLEERNRDLFLFDTFEGMPEPQEAVDGKEACEQWRSFRRKTNGRWCAISREEVRENLYRVGYPETRIHLVKGKVEETIPAHAPEQIALLRLDTDYYSSTMHEFTHLFPRLSPGGILIVDDYGSFQGSRTATDEYIRKLGLRLLLHRIDACARLAVKQ